MCPSSGAGGWDKWQFPSPPPLCFWQATIEWEAQEEGFLARILMPEGSKDVAVGTPVAVLVEDEGGERQGSGCQEALGTAGSAAFGDPGKLVERLGSGRGC